MFNRASVSNNRGTGRTSMEATYPAPRGGWVRNDNLTNPMKETATVLRNGFPTADGVRMRRGSLDYAEINGAVTHLCQYNSGAVQKLFATSPDSIFDISEDVIGDTFYVDIEYSVSGYVDDESLTADVDSLLNGDWSSVQFTPGSGSPYLILVNGVDDMQQFDGSTWTVVTGDITGVDTADLSHVWSFKSRLFFVEGGTMSAWYLDVNAITGAASELPLGSIFKRGGSLLFGATWSVDAGDGMDDTCIFVTSEGEVAVYQGNDPSDVNDWSLVGRYDIGRPLHKNAHFRGGGDIAILTFDGIIPVSSAMKSDRAALSQTSVSFPIESAWIETTAQRGNSSIPFSCVIWPTETMLVVGLPVSGSMEKLVYVANSRTGKWAEYTGWDARSLIVFADQLYFGTNEGKITKGEVGGSDNGLNYTFTALGRFDSFKSSAIKEAIHARAILKTGKHYNFEMFANADHNVEIPLAPNETEEPPDDSAWGSGVWGTSIWGESQAFKPSVSEWQTVAAVGESLALGFQLTAGRVPATDVELVSTTLVYQNGVPF